VAARTPVIPTALRSSERRENRADPCSGSPDINPSPAVIPELLSVPDRRMQRRNADRPSLIIYDSLQSGLFRQTRKRIAEAVPET